MRAIPQEKENTRHEERDNGENGEPHSNTAPAGSSCRNRRNRFDFRCLIQHSATHRYFPRRALADRMHLRDEAIAPTSYGRNVPLASRGVAENSPQGGNILSKVIFLDDAVRPYGFHD